MPRFFFDLSDGTQEPDHTGTEFRDGAAAQREAVRYAGEVLRHEPDRLDHGAMKVDVRDEARRHLFSVEVRLSAQE